jgi:glycerophosphoryl diester phosphodiesterase
MPSSETERRGGFLAASITLALIFLAGCGDDSGGGSGKSRPRDVFFEDRVLNIAHRGGARLRPEHTIAAYENALTIGADVVELDLHATADGVVVCLHDATVDRTTNGTGTVRDMFFQEVHSLDAGYRFTRDRGATYPYRGAGLTIPTLDEALDLLGEVPLSVEIKQSSPPIVEQVMATFEAHGAVENGIFVAFDSRPVQAIRERNPEALTAFTAQEILTFGTLTDETLPSYTPPAMFIQPPQELVDAAFMARANALGLRVHAWTVNDRAEMHALIDAGVSGIFTDDPETLEELLEMADG